MKRSDNYASNQIRLFLGDLKIGNHASKLKALQKFQSYIEQNKPEISDDNVEFLFTGINNISGTTVTGLLSHCGQDSDKHPGQLKRICGPLISFVNWLINPAECGDEVYFATFTRLAAEELVKINFPKHILNQTEPKITLNLQGQTRSGSSDDAFSLLQVLYTDHRTIDDEPDPIDIGYLLQNNKVCLDKFAAWMQRSNFDFVTEELANRGKKVMSKVIARPSRWDEVQFRAIPLQEGEDVGSAEVDEDPVVPPPILDPLRLRDVDLRETQEVFATGGLEKRMLMNRRASDAVALRSRSVYAGHPSSSNNGASQVMSLLLEDDDDDNDDPQQQEIARRFQSRSLPSVIPSDKSFSVSLFLSLVHGGTSFDELNTGLQNLHSHLKEQSTRRVNLVRNHFGLFSQCAEGLEWLRDFRRGVIRQSDLTPIKDAKTRLSMTPPGFTTSNTTKTTSTPNKVVPIDKFMENFKRAQGTLELAKVEAKNTLAPILERMKRVREIKSAEKVLKGMSTLLDYPRSMKTALERGELKDCVAIYHRIKDIPTAMMKITQRIKNTAENIIFDLKKSSLTTLLTPNINGALLVRHALIFLEIDGEKKEFLQFLRFCFLRQLMEFFRVWKELRDRFIHDCVEAFDKGQEMNLMAKNAALFLEVGGNNVNSAENSVLAVARRYYTNNSSNGSSNSTSNRRRVSITVANGINSSNNSYLDRRPSASSIANSTIALNRRPSLNSHSLDLEDADEAESPRFDLESQKNDFFLSDSSSNNNTTNNSNFSTLESMLLDFEQGNNNEGNTKDYSEFLVMLVRRSFADRLLDHLTKWFPCLFLLACETFQQTQNLGQNTQNNNKRSTFSGVNKSQNFGVISPLRLLGMTLTTVMDQLQQVSNGMKPSFHNSTFMSVDVITAIHELEVELPTLISTYNLPFNMSNDITLTSINATLNSSLRFNDIITSYIFSSSLKLAMQHEEVLGEVFQLYEAMEMAVQNAKQKMIRNTLNPGAAGYRPFPNTASTAQDNQSNVELEVTSPLSPFHESFTILSALAKESETAITQKLLDKLFFKFHTTTETLLFETDVEVLYQTRLFSVSNLENLESLGNIGFRSQNLGLGGLGMIGVELTVVEFEMLVSKGIDALRMNIHRVDWIHSQIIDFFLVKMMKTTLFEKYRRKMFFIEDMTKSAHNNSSFASSNSTTSPTTRQSLLMRRRRQQSLQQLDQWTLISLEDELKSLDIGFEEVNFFSSSSTVTSKSKNKAYLDFLRALIRLRSFSLPKMLKKISHVFSLDYSYSGGIGNGLLDMSTSVAITKSNSNNSAQNKGKEESSMLSRLFTSTTPAAAAADPAQDNSSNVTRRNRRVVQVLETPNSTVVNNTNTQNLTFHEKVTLNWLDCYFREFGDLNSTFFGQSVLKPLLVDMVKMEFEVVEEYLKLRQKGLKEIVFASYTYMVEQELRSANTASKKSESSGKGLPIHTSRIIMALHEEKKMLSTVLGGLSLDDHEVNYHLYKQQQQSHSSPNADNTDSEDDSPSNNSSKKNGYATYLYQQLCRGLLEVYEELIEKLYAGSMGSSSSTTASSSSNSAAAPAPPVSPFKAGNKPTPSTAAAVSQSSQQVSALPVKTILQAVEEWEFLKLVLRPILVNLQVLQKVVLSPSELQLISLTAQRSTAGGVQGSVMNREELLQAGQILTILIQQA